MTQFLRIRTRNGTRLVKRSRGRTMSDYLHGRDTLKGIPMFINKENGAKVRLTAQDERSICHFVDAAGGAHTLPSHVFFTQYREATAEEIAAAEAAPEAGS